MFDYTRSFYNPREPRELPSQSAGIDVLTGARKAARDALVDSANQNDARERARTRRQTFTDILTPISAGLNAIVSRGNDQPVQIGAEFADPIHPDNRNMLAMARGGEFDEEDVLIVGEEGPEVVIPRRGGGGTVIPNDEYDQWVRDVDDGYRTPPFNSSPAWREAERRAMGRESSAVPLGGRQPWGDDNPIFKGLAMEGSTAIPLGGFAPEQYGLGQTEDERGRANVDLSGAPVTGPASGMPDNRGALDPMQKEYEELAKAQEVKPSPWKDFGYGLLQGLNNALNHRNAPIEGWSEKKARHRAEPIAARIALKERQNKIKSDEAYRQAQMNNMTADNERQNDERLDRKERADAQRKAQALNKLVTLKRVDPKNTAHAAIIAAAGLEPEDVQGWDDTNPYTKQVAGVTYIYDKTDQTFKPSNLPTDESATLTDYQIKMPSGEFRTYKVAQKDAARFAMQMQTLGAQIEAADRRQASTQAHETRKIQMQGQIRMLLEQYKAAVAAGNAAQAQQFRLQMEAARQQAKQEGLDN